ncbi:MAG: hypothetical protein KF805_09835 [Phycisphaeraceae bacterium]|nr:hypothetical protein [Phycisphaeraceae bacterium]
MKRSPAAVASSLLLAVCGAAQAAPWIEPLPVGFYVTDLSYDGTAAAGNITGDGSYETFRWTAATSVVPLGQASVPAIGVGGGSPDISYDGTRVSASILSSDNNLTLGLWTEGQGWSEAFPPAPEFVLIQDQTYGSAWGLSGDGRMVTGYYITSNLSSKVQGCGWSPTDGLTDYASPRARVNAASYNGSVVAGWEDNAAVWHGSWSPTVWRDGTKYYLSDALGSTQVTSVNIDGSFAVGYGPDEFGGQQAATVWHWNGAGYDTQVVGYLPETVYTYGNAQFTSISDDGKIAVGNNRLAFNPNQGVKAIIWTAETGLVEGYDYLDSIGVTLPENFDLRDFQSISPDGSTIAAAGVNLDYFVFQTILIHLHDPCPADTNSDWQVDDSDFVVFANSYDVLDCTDPTMPLRCPADLNHDGLVDDTDFVMFAAAYDQLLCP